MERGRCALVTGATGSVGRTLVKHLIAAGYSVRALIRNPDNPVQLPPKVQLFRGDLLDSRVLQEALHDADVVFHLAARLHVNSRTYSELKELRRTNVEGTVRIAKLAAQASVRRFIFFSTINVYGTSRDRSIVDETSPNSPRTGYAQTKLEGERIVLDTLPSVVLRCSAVYGPGMRGNYPRLIKLLRKFPVMIGNGSNRRTLVYVSDLCEAARLASENESALGRIFNVTDGAIHTLKEIVEAIALALGRKRPELWVAEGKARRVANFIDSGLLILGLRSSLAMQAVEKLLEDVAVSGVRIQRELGFRPSVDMAQGWKMAIDTT